MSVKTRQCFLIDSILEKPLEDKPEKQEEAIDLIKRSPSTSSRLSQDGSDHEEEEEEDEEEAEISIDGDVRHAEEGEEPASRLEDEPASRLEQLIENMMDKQGGREGQQAHQNTPTLPRPLLPMGSPMEYLSKLHLMQHALNLSALAMRQPFPNQMMPMLRKDVLFQRPLPLLRPPRSSNEPSRGNTKKYRCDVCEKTFSRSNTLITHKRIHTGEKPFKCDHCGRAFRQPGNLTRHRLTHTTVKPYVCAHCDKAFNRASNLHTHMRTHNGGK